MTTPPEESMLERAARAGLASIDNMSTYIGDKDDLRSVIIDGDIDVLAFTRAVLQAIRDPDEATIFRSCVSFGLNITVGRRIWNRMIDFILERG